MRDDERERLLQRVFQMAYLMLGRREAAEDVAQETILRVLDRGSQFRGEGEFGAWAWAIAVNLCRARRIADRNRPKAVDPAVLSEARVKSHGPVSNAILLETHERAEAALRRLTPALRETFVLHYIEELSYKDIAAITGVSEFAARLRARRARLALQADLWSFFEPEVRSRLERDASTAPAAKERPRRKEAASPSPGPLPALAPVPPSEASS